MNARVKADLENILVWYQECLSVTPITLAMVEDRRHRADTVRKYIASLEEKAWMYDDLCK
jgi:hypothetical protein